MKLTNYLKKVNPGKELVVFFEEISNNYHESKRIQLFKRTSSVLSHIVWGTPITGAPTFYTDGNKSGKAGCKSKNLSKLDKSPYDLFQKSKLYAILMVLRNFKEPHNIVTDLPYAERVVLHIKTAEFIPDDTELISLFFQLPRYSQEWAVKNFSIMCQQVKESIRK